MWEAYRRMSPWVRTPAGGFALNPRFRKFPTDAPRPYVQLCARCGRRHTWLSCAVICHALGGGGGGGAERMRAHVLHRPPALASSSLVMIT